MLWAERNDRVFLTVEVQDSKEPKVDIKDEGVVSVSASNSEGVHYEVKLELLQAVNAKARLPARRPRRRRGCRRYAAARRGADGGGARARAQESKVAVTPRSICLVVMKASPGPYWGKLLKAPGKPPHYVRVDWTKFKDEDEEAEGAGARPPPLPRPPAAHS